MSDLSPTASPAPRIFHRVSPSRIWTLATNTFTQLLRMKTLYFLIVFVIALLIFGFIVPAPPTGQGLATFGGEQELRLLKSVALGAMSWFCAILAIAGTALLIPRDLEDRTLYTILCKPVPRYDYLLGKLGGVLLLLLISLVVMDAACCGALALKQNALINQEIAYWLRHEKIIGPDGAPTVSPERLAQIKAIYARYGLDMNFHAAVLGIFWQAAIMASIVLLISTFSSSSLFSILAGLAILIIGQGQELARGYLFKDVIGAAGPEVQRLFSVAIAMVLPDLRQFNVIDEVVAGTVIPTALLWRMSGIALLYLAFYNVLSWWIFSDKEL